MKVVIMIIVIMFIAGCDNAMAIRDSSDSDKATVVDLQEGVDSATLDADVVISVDGDQPQINDGVVAPDNTQPDVEIPDGAPAYEIDNGTVIAQMTGLRWQRSQSPMMLSYEQAVSYCENLVLNNITNWRLPTINEMRTIIYNCPNNMEGGSCKLSNDCNNNNQCDTECNKCDGIDANNPALDKRVWDIAKGITSDNYQLYTSTKAIWVGADGKVDEIGMWSFVVMRGYLSSGISAAYAKCVR